MPKCESLHRVKWTNALDVNPEFVWFTCVDTYTQETYRFRLPLFVLPSFENHIARALELNADAFSQMTTRRIG